MSSKERQKAFPDATGRPTLQDVGRLISGGQAKKIVIMVRTSMPLSDASLTSPLRPAQGSALPLAYQTSALQIPDFTRMYVIESPLDLVATDDAPQLEKYSLPQPEAIFDINCKSHHAGDTPMLTFNAADFVRRPAAFFTLAKELWPNNFKPTLAHYFFVLLHQKGLLLRCADCLQGL